MCTTGLAAQTLLACAAWAGGAANGGSTGFAAADISLAAALRRAADGLTGTFAFGVLLPLSLTFKLEQHARDAFARPAAEAAAHSSGCALQSRASLCRMCFRARQRL